MKKRLGAFLLTILIFISSVPVYADSEASLRILFTHDIHSHLEMASRLGGAIEKEKGDWKDDNVLVLDAGDFSQGTLYQAGFETHALEIGLLSKLGYDACAIGNHEWDHDGDGLAAMLNSAAKLYDNLPVMLCSNIDFSGDLISEQQNVKDALLQYDKKAGNDNSSYFIKEMPNGLNVGIFALAGIDSISCSPSSGMKWTNYIDSAKKLVKEIKDDCDLIICLSHGGTSSRDSGEDVELAKAVPDIDLIISGHTHSTHSTPIMVGDTAIVSSGCYLSSLGCIDIALNSNGIEFNNYRVLDLNAQPESSETASYIDYCDRIVKETYLGQYGFESSSQIIAHSSFDFISLDEMYATHQEYPLGNLIADSYIYAAKQNGINDIDVALVGLGTIRDSISIGDISVEDAFTICSLGAGEDGSAGHPLLCAYISGKELKLLAELDASLGPMVSSIKMSYSGLRYMFNTKRMILDRTTQIALHDEFGIVEDREIEDDKLYKVCCNMYAANMLGMLNGLTKGILSITPKNADGSSVENFYDVQMLGKNGKPVKEWVAFADYLDYLEEIPDAYNGAQGRKTSFEASDLESRLMHPGLTTWVLFILVIIVIAAIILIVKAIKRGIKKTGKKTNSQ